MIMSWLWNSMTPEISDTCMFLPTAKTIWDALYQTYSKVNDAALIYDIKTTTTGAKQGSKTVTEYANFLQNQWQELDYYRTIDLTCSKCAVAIKKFIERDRVYDFLAGLNSEFDIVRIQILGRTEVPSLMEAISLVRAEESRRGIMLESPSTENSALLSSKPQRLILDRTTVNRSNISNGYKGRDEVWCTYCKKPRHTKEKCWKLHGKPSMNSREWGQKGGQSASGYRQAHVSLQESTQTLGGFSMNEIEKLKGLLGTMDKSATQSSHLTSTQDRLKMDKRRQEKVHKYEEFVDRRLKPDLVRAIGERDKVFEQQKTFSELRRSIENLEEHSVTNLRTLVNLGSEVYMQADVPDTQRIFVDAGLGFHVEFTWSEALNYISAREERIARQIEEYTRLIASIKAHIKLVYGGIQELLDIPADKAPQEPIF